jgi:hypothetical protein
VKASRGSVTHVATIVRVVRPFQNEAEFLAAEAWTIDDKTVLLIGQPELAKRSLVRFEVTLESGATLLRAEAKVLRYDPPREDRPGGLRVKLKRYNASTKALIIRALEARKLQAQAVAEEAPESEPQPLELVIPVLDAPGSDALVDVAPDSDVSQVRTSTLTRVDAPPNRDALLERLRERARRSG